jgi:murein L,D-transpeptidase YcbB/YkuD
MNPGSKIPWSYGIFLIALCLMQACHTAHRPPRHDVIAVKEDLDQAIQKNILQLLNFDSAATLIIDSDKLFRPDAIRHFYSLNRDHPCWSLEGKQLPAVDSLLEQLREVWEKGLDSGSYYVRELTAEDRLAMASSRRDAAVWARLDLLLTSACMKLLSDLHYGILPTDSLRTRKDSAYSNDILARFVGQAKEPDSLKAMISTLQPRYRQYALLETALQEYIRAHRAESWDLVISDSLHPGNLDKQVALRLVHGGELDSSQINNTSEITGALKRFQVAHGLFTDGKPGKRTLAALNVTFQERVMQIRLNIDRWRHLGDSLPHPVMLVNIPSFLLEIWDRDTLRLESRVVVGKPQTPTPQLTSAITNFQLYPYWRLPMSIIVKDVFPGIKKNKKYLEKFNLEVVDRHGNVVDSSKLNWKRYNKNYFPYVLRQMTGLDNSLGIIKFNFRNKYSVYLHDTNLRYLFGAEYRALSHGCVRLQKWDSLSRYLVRNDTLRHIPDSLAVWEKEQLQKQVSFSQRLPIYIRYFTCRVNDKGRLIFNADLYGYDSIQEKQLSTLGKTRE